MTQQEISRLSVSINNIHTVFKKFKILGNKDLPLTGEEMEQLSNDIKGIANHIGTLKVEELKVVE